MRFYFVYTSSIASDYCLWVFLSSLWSKVFHDFFIGLHLVRHTLLYFLRISGSNSATETSKSNPFNKTDISCLDKLSENKAWVSSIKTLYSSISSHYPVKKKSWKYRQWKMIRYNKRKNTCDLTIRLRNKNFDNKNLRLMSYSFWLSDHWG